MGGLCGRYGEMKMYTGFLWGNWKERVHLEDPQHSCEGNIKWILKK